MDVRLIVGSLLFLAVPAVAQDGAAAKPATPELKVQEPKVQEPKAQDPDKPQQTPEAAVVELSKEKERLQREIRYAQERATNAKALLREKFTPSKPAWRAIDAGVTAAPVAPVEKAAQPIQARVAKEGELESFGQDGLLLVNGSPIRKPQFDAVMSYLRTVPNSGDDTQRAQRVLMEMIRTEVACTAFADSDARAKATEVLQQLAAGKSAAELAKANGVVPGASPEGRLEVTRNSALGAVLEHAAFTTKVGERTDPMRTALGVVVMQVAAVEKGASAELDKVQVDAILIPLTEDQMMLDKVLDSAMSGQVQLLARDDATLSLLPPIFRPRANAPLTVKGVDAGTLQRTLDTLGAEMQKLQAATDEASKARLQQLQKQYEQTKMAMKAMQATSPAADGVEIQSLEKPKEKKQ